MSPLKGLAWQLGVLASGGLVGGLCAMAGAYMQSRPSLARFAPAMQAAGAIAYDALAAACRQPGALDYAVARAVALTEAEGALKQLAPKIPAQHVAALAKASLGAKLAADPAFSATGGLTATATAEPGGEAAAAATMPQAAETTRPLPASKSLSS